MCHAIPPASNTLPAEFQGEPSPLAPHALEITAVGIPGHRFIPEPYRYGKPALVGGSPSLPCCCETKRQLEMGKLLKKLSRFNAMMINDFDYVKQDRDAMEVLFTLLAHRCERGGMLITSNLPFSKWEVIFKNPMTTAAAIDPLVHHSIVLELNAAGFERPLTRSPSMWRTSECSG
ncbi:MAG: ATP-binding protein [Phycisphaerales bacterium]|nr:MAG: ATP-binding protein [Phycisphaerales bacterium]